MFSRMSRLTGLAGGTVFGVIACAVCTSASAGQPSAASPQSVAYVVPTPAPNTYPNGAPAGTVQAAAMPQAATPPAPTPYAYPYGNTTGAVPAGVAKQGPATTTTISREELERLPERMNNLERTVNQLNGIVNSQVLAAEKAKKEAEETKKKLESGWWNKTKISGRMYYDLSYINNESEGVRQSNSGTGFDIKRFYVGIDHQFTDVFSADITTDFTFDSTTKATQVFIKKAYLEANFDPAFDLRVGSTDLPWVPWVEGLYGYRYIENIMIDRTKYGTSADWGVHAKGKLADGMFNYAFSVVNGAGYKNPDIGSHTNTMDFEGRVDAHLNNFIVGVGGYVGKLGKDAEGSTTHHTASRFDALAGYFDKQVRVGVEFFEAWNFMNVTTVASDRSDGVSGFASYQFNPEWGVFGRYDFVQPNLKTNSDLKDNYFNVGIAYSPTKIVDFALVYKRDHAGDGNLATSNGTIGGMTSTTGSGTYDEVGIFGRFRW